MARLTFGDTFTHYTPEDLEQYVSENLTSEAMAKELAEPGSFFYFVLFNGQRVGYLKWLYPTTKYLAHFTLKKERPLLLQRFYFLPEHAGQGLGSVSLAFVESYAKHQAGADYLYLSVWDRNYRAQSFYQKHGFRTVGSFAFPVGGELDHELLFGKNL